MKKRILVLAPSSYPTFGAEAIVNIKLLKALADSELFEIDLVSQKVKWCHYPNEELDVSLRSVHVVETDLKVTLRLIWEHIYAFLKFGVTFKAVHWAVKALPIVEKLLQANRYDYVLTKDYPSFVLGDYIKKRYGVKWVATWNDPFPLVKYPEPYGKGASTKGSIFDRMCLPVMENADVHIFPSDRLKSYILSYLKVDAEKAITIPHVVLDVDVENSLDDNQLRIIHSGTLQHPRSPKTFLKAFARFKNQNPDAHVSVDILGIMEAEDRELIQQYGIQDSVNFLSPVTYSESLRMLASYHVALIIEANCEEGIFLPTKVSDFMQYRKPIFAVSPRNGVLRDLYDEGCIDYFSDVTDVDAICDTLNDIYSDFLENRIREKGKCTYPSFLESTIVNQYYNF